MVKSISGETCLRYMELLPKNREIGDPPLPITLTRQGQVKGPFDYVLPDQLLIALRKWLNDRGDNSVFYFLTESVEGEETDFEISVPELTHTTLSDINVANENLIVGHEFDWALFTDHEGILHVAGPEDLFSFLKDYENYEEKGYG